MERDRHAVHVAQPESYRCFAAPIYHAGVDGQAGTGEGKGRSADGGARSQDEELARGVIAMHVIGDDPRQRFGWVLMADDIRVVDVPELKSETWENISVPDIVMLSSSGDFGKWNFGFEVQVGWDKQLSLPASRHNIANPFGSPVPRLPTPQSDHSEGSVMFHFTYEAGSYTIRTGWTCPWCEKGSFGSLDALQQHLTFCHELFHLVFFVGNRNNMMLSNQ